MDSITTLPFRKGHILGVAALMLLPTIVLSFLAPKVSSDRTQPIEVGSISIVKKRGGISIPNTPELSPTENQNFYVSLWFQPHDLPRDEERVVLISKIDTERKAIPGYAIALRRVSDEIRPEVYWKNQEGRGRWFTFAPWSASPHSWHLLLLSFRDNRYLSLHGAIVSEKNEAEPQLLGGYDFDGEPLLAQASSPLEVGAVKRNSIGEIGPFGVIAGGSIRISTSALMRELLENPSEPPSMFRENAVKLWRSHPGGNQPPE